MRIAMIGCKGIPAAMALGGGVETHVEELSTRLAQRGHQVTVYVRPYANPRHDLRFKGVRLVTLPSIPTKSLDTWTHTLVSTLHALSQPYDIVHYHGVGPSTLASLIRLFRPSTKIVVTFHSRDRFHSKWGLVGKLYLAVGEWTAVRFPHATIAVSHAIQLGPVWYRARKVFLHLEPARASQVRRGRHRGISPCADRHEARHRRRAAAWCDLVRAAA
jgi:glycosyltransferase involved in cell wall biosynthesis